MLGNMLRDREQQYISNKDETTQTWRILDTWHDALRSLGPEDEVPDDSEAVTILTEGAFISLVKEAGRLGVLQNAASVIPEEDSSMLEDLQSKEDELQVKEEKLMEYRRELEVLKVKATGSESFKIKEKALEAVIKLAAMSDVTSLSGE